MEYFEEGDLPAEIAGGMKAAGQTITPSSDLFSLAAGPL